MTPEKWTSTVNNIKDSFEVSDEGHATIDEEGGIDISFIEFKGPIGKMRLEFITKPVILDKKTTYSKRIGSETQIDYVYSDDERSSQLLVYKWNENDNDWEEMETAMFDN